MAVRSAAHDLLVPTEAAAAGTREREVMIWDPLVDMALVAGERGVPRPLDQADPAYVLIVGTSSRM